MWFFIGAIGPERTYVVCEEKAATGFFAEFNGLSVFTYYGSRRDSNVLAALRPPCTQICERIRKLGQRRRSVIGAEQAKSEDAPTSAITIGAALDNIGLERIFDDYTSAEQDILSALKTSKGPIRIFLQIGNQTLAGRGTIFEEISSIGKEKSTDIRILHSDEKSPLFARDRLTSMEKNFEAIHESLRYVKNSLTHLSNQIGGSLRHRQHDLPFIWRIYAFEDKLYLIITVTLYHLELR